MSTEAMAEWQNPNSDKERVLAYVSVCNEGASILGTSISTQIPRSRVESILKELVTEGRIVGSRSSKKGYGLYYPPPEPKVIPRFDQTDRLASYEHKVDAGEIPTPDPVADRAAPDHFPHDDGTTIPCQKCAKDGEEFNAKSSLGMSIHLSKHHGIKGTSRTGKGHPHTKVGADIKGTCRHCHREFPLGKLRRHEPVCGKNPNRNGGKSKALREDPPEPVLIDDTVPPLSSMEPPKDHVPYPYPEEQSIILECGEACTIPLAEGGTLTNPDSLEIFGEHSHCSAFPMPEVPKEAVNFTINIPSGPENLAQTLERMYRKRVQAQDPLALFAQQHRLRANKEISNLKRVERKLHRRAASLENMAERVHDARQIKERELRKFERELAEVRG